VHEQALEHIVGPPHVHATEPTGFIEMRAGSFQYFAAGAEESFPAVTEDPSSIRINGVASRPLLDPRLWAAIGFADVGPSLQRLKIVHHLPAVIALVGHDFLDASHGIVCDGTGRVELPPVVLDRLGVSPSNRRDSHFASCCALTMSVAALGDGDAASRGGSSRKRESTFPFTHRGDTA
jgi:hypothetical protein